MSQDMDSEIRENAGDEMNRNIQSAPGNKRVPEPDSNTGGVPDPKVEPASSTGGGGPDA